MEGVAMITVIAAVLLVVAMVFCLSERLALGALLLVLWVGLVCLGFTWSANTPRVPVIRASQAIANYNFEDLGGPPTSVDAEALPQDYFVNGYDVVSGPFVYDFSSTNTTRSVQYTKYQYVHKRDKVIFWPFHPLGDPKPVLHLFPSDRQKVQAGH